MSITTKEFATQIEKALGFKVSVRKNTGSMKDYFTIKAYRAVRSLTIEESVSILKYLVDSGISAPLGTYDWELKKYNLDEYSKWSFDCRVSSIKSI